VPDLSQYTHPSTVQYIQHSTVQYIRIHKNHPVAGTHHHCHVLLNREMLQGSSQVHQQCMACRHTQEEPDAQSLVLLHCCTRAMSDHVAAARDTVQTHWLARGWEARWGKLTLGAGTPEDGARERGHGVHDEDLEARHKVARLQVPTQRVGGAGGQVRPRRKGANSSAIVHQMRAHAAAPRWKVRLRWKQEPPLPSPPFPLPSSLLPLPSLLPNPYSPLPPSSPGRTGAGSA